MSDIFYLAHPMSLLQERARQALKGLRECRLCPRLCGVDRLGGETGICQTGRQALVASYNLHFGEEDPLVGEQGSGTIFFAGCNLGCLFCQNFDISHSIQSATAVDAEQLAGLMLELQNQGAANINFVTPTHVLPQILEALPLAVQAGLRLPLVYNSGGYDRPESLRLAEGLIQIYMPDLKFADPEPAENYCQARDYPEVAARAVKEMHRQVGDLQLDSRGLALQGLLVRHLLLPNGLAGTEKWLDYLTREISPQTYLNLMDQYRPCGRASEYPELQGMISARDFSAAKEKAREYGLERLDSRERPKLQALLRRMYHGE
ncbi:MAG: radical SAM protein [Desulfohalobiaceae bacterium]